MDEMIEKLQQEIETLKKENAQLRETLETIENINRSNEIGKYIQQRKRALTIANLINTVSENKTLSTNQFQKELEEAIAEKMILSAKIADAMKGVNITEIKTEDSHGDLSYVETFEGIEIQSYNRNSTEETLVMPDYIDGRPVVQIGRKAFKNAKFKKILLPQKLIRINSSAFQECKYLEYIEFPERLQVIDDMAFMGCRNLKAVQLSDSLSSLGKQSFSNTGLEQVELPKNLKEVQNSTFSGCHNLKIVVLKENLKRIGDYAFFDTAIKNVAIPLTVEYIGKSAFGNAHQFGNKIEVLILNKNTYVESLPSSVVIHWIPQKQKVEIPNNINRPVMKYPDNSQDLYELFGRVLCLAYKNSLNINVKHK